MCGDVIGFFAGPLTGGVDEEAWLLAYRCICVHIHCCRNGRLGLRSYSGHSWKSREPDLPIATQAPPLGTSLRLGVPERRPGSVGREGPFMAQHPASMPGFPLRNTYVRPSWLTGRPRSKACRGGFKTDLALAAVPDPCGSGLARENGLAANLFVAAAVDPALTTPSRTTPGDRPGGGPGASGICARFP